MAEQLKLEHVDSVVEDQEEELDFSGRPSWAANSRPSEEGEERTLSRRRSLECSSIEVKIVGTELTQGHTMYVMQVSSGAKRWTVYRRFKDFDFLDKQLRKLFPNLKIPTLPPKRYFGSSNEAEFVESRRQQLESYLNTLVGLQSIWSRNDLALFLNNESNSMMFIWNFEKMRRLQDMVSTMNVEKETETAKLTSDLSGAKDQVNQLQDKLSRMEMLFLQQATGVAAEELPPNALRTLSGINNSLSYQLASELTEEHMPLYNSKSNAEAHVLPKKLDDEEIQRQNVIEDAIQAQVTSGEVLSPDQVKRVLSLTREPETTLLDLKSRTPEDVKQVAMSIQLQEAININNKIFDENFEIGGQTSKITSRTSEMDLSRLLTPRKTSPVTVAPAEHTVYDYQPGVQGAPWVPLLLKQVDELVSGLAPTQASLISRHKVFQYVRNIVSATLGVQLFPVGSFVSHTFLPDGDLDTTAFVLKNDDDSWFVKVNEALCMSAFNQNPSGSSKSSSFDTNPESSSAAGVIINNVSFVNGDIKMIKSMIDNISVDISVNQLNALYAQSLVEKIDDFVKNDHLFKRSVLLTKAWCLYDSPRHTHGAGSLSGGKDGKITSWAVIVMLLWVFQSEGKSIAHPIQALGHFLRIYSTFNWDLYALTVRGPVSAVDLSPVAITVKNDQFFPTELLSGLSEMCEETHKMVCFPNQSNTSVAAPSIAASSSEDVTPPVPVNSVDSAAAAPSAGGSVPVPPSIEIPPIEGAASTSAPPTPAAATPHNNRDGSKSAVVVNQWVARSAFPEADYSHVQGLINIMDPVVPTMNLARSVDAHGFDAIVSSIQEGYKSFQTFCSVFSKVATGANNADAEEELSSATKLFLLNTVNRVFSLSLTVARSVAPQIAEVQGADWFAAQLNELEFSLHYGELVLGGKVHQDTLIQLIVQILVQKGQMPVGEIGKNLQLITGCENLSRRLKEQFQGLKKSIEFSNSTRLKVGTEHPFNPIVALDGQEEPVNNDPIPAFGHVGFVFTPLVVTLSAANVKDAATKATTKQSFRRAAPYYIENRGFDQMSAGAMSGNRATVNTGYYRQGGGYGGQSGSPRARNGGNNVGLNNPTSPGRYANPNVGGGSVGGFRGPPPPMGVSQLHQQLAMHPQPPPAQQQQPPMPGMPPQQGGIPQLSSGMMHAVDQNGNPLVLAQQPDGSMSYVPASSFGSYGSPSIQSMNAYQQQHHQQHMAFLQQQQMYQNYAISMGASLGSSYGASPSNMSYMHYAEQQNMAYQQQIAQHQAMMQQQQMQQQQQQQQRQHQQQHQQQPHP